MPPMVIADLGAGEGTFLALLAQRAKKVIAVDNSEKMVEFGARPGRASTASRTWNTAWAIWKTCPSTDGSVDLAFFSQSLHHALHPERAIAEAWRILKPGGRIAILDLCKHRFEEAREMYADLWLGFTEVELEPLFHKAGFQNVLTSVVHKEAEAPHFQTLASCRRQAESVKITRCPRHPLQRRAFPNAR